MIDIYLFEQLVAVKNNKTLIKASESLGISQPALSKSMKKLEDLLQIELFHRTNTALGNFSCALIHFSTDVCHYRNFYK